ncbi:HPP family-domain-containing protein [Scenedesmus sp. NREL 46B-D3]|nr:HPP family-domain-containing protein [Scenedesmus sp. NREL 46B-D3]
MHQNVEAPGEGSVHRNTPQHHQHPEAGHGVEPVLDVRGEEVWSHHTHPVIIGRHSVRLSDDVTVTVAEDEPVKGAVESDIAQIEHKPESKLRRYFNKWRGDIDTATPFPSFQDAAVSWLGAFLGILLVSVTDLFLWRNHEFRMLVASFGASAVLLYGVPESKLAQPRNVIGGQVVSAIVGVCVRLALERVQWLANAVGMSLALLAMQLTCTTHPPGGATALIACSAPVMAPWHGFQLVLAVCVGSVELTAVALLISNFHRGRAYPTFWW